MDFDGILRTLGGLGMLGAMLGGIGFAIRRVKRDADEIAPIHRLSDVRAVALGHVVPGERVRVSGVATPAGPLVKSLFGGRACIAYQCMLVIVNDDHREVISGDCCDFYLEDGGVRALVRSGFFTTELVVSDRGEWTSETLPAHVRDWLMEATASDVWEHSRHLLWAECRVEPGARVCVIGAAQLQVDEHGGADYRESAELLTFGLGEDEIDGRGEDERLVVSNEPELLEPPTS